ncbi:MAG: cadmium-translocating P-type ATPase [Armatimonadetes bacterium]|nr:cadmium-translocating P-type ATPase [Armatimonadota bacterium]
MVGRYAGIHKYRELLQMKEFYRVFGGVLLIATGYLLGKNAYPLLGDISLLLALLILGGPIVIGAAGGLLNRELNVDELVSLAIVASVVIGEYGEAAIVALIMVLGSLLEEFTAQKSRSAINALIRLNPEQATLLRDGTGVSVPVGEIRVGDKVIIRSGEKVPVDGKVIHGCASFNEASLTGESLPVEKAAGDMIFAGSVCYAGMVVAEAQKIGAATTLGKLIKIVQDAESQKAPILRIADRYARYFTPVIVSFGAAVYLFTEDIHRAIAVLIVGCPCAFILSAPTAVVAALGNASRNGILIKGGALLEQVARVDVMVFDKTGTLTAGMPVVTGITPLNGASEDQVLAAAAAAEKYSEHPLGQAVVHTAKQRGLELAEPERFKNAPGIGVEAFINGRSVFVGGLTPGETAGLEKLIALEPQKGTKTLVVKENGFIIGVIYLQDILRPEVPALVKSLREAGIRKVQMLTGDDDAVAARIAGVSGIKEYRAGLLPEQKLEQIKEYQNYGRKVAMVGDGINDAPSLAAADIGIAMGAMGTDVAMEAADIVLMNDDLTKLPYLLRLGKATINTINFNIAFAVVFNALALIGSGLGFLNPIMGAVVHNFGSVLVVLNSARLVAFRLRNAAFVPGQNELKVCEPAA